MGIWLAADVAHGWAAIWGRSSAELFIGLAGWFVKASKIEGVMSRRSISPALRAPVFHFTDTIHLPWILASGELRPNRETLPGVGHLRYLWGTTNPEGDYTSAPQRAIHHGREADWQAGIFQLVRFTLPADAFMTWNEIVRESDWTPAGVAELVEYDQREFDEYGHDLWRCRWDPMRLANALKVEVTGFKDHETERWWPLDLSDPKLRLPSRKANRLGVRIGRRRFYSDRHPTEIPDRFSYVPWPDPDKSPAKRAAEALERRMEKAYLSRRQLEEEDAYEVPER